MLSSCRVWPVTSAYYDIVILCFAHGSFTTRGEWSWYDVDFWPQGQIHRVYDMALCSGHSFFVLWHSHIMSVSSWYYVSHTFMTSVWPWPWPLTSISKVYIFTMNLTWQDPLALWHSIPILVYGCITRRQHVVYILDLCLTITFHLYGVNGVS